MEILFSFGIILADQIGRNQEWNGLEEMYVKTACGFTHSLRKMLYCVSDINLKFTVMQITSALVNGSALRFHLPRFLCVRHHSSTKLFVTGLSYDTNEPILRDAFGQHGEIIEVKVICDHVTGKSRGYGFVRFVSETTAAAARKEMNGQILDGRRIRVSYAHKGERLSLPNNS
ncbi:hypothetical protein JHK84_033314 [Glycine max]|nr:hypothetical protein JHK85_033684 [Glycine max]KAG5139546.1 hypothetical protein JHK84_033314 [Glycine max]